MGVSSGIPVHARYRHGPDRLDDRGQAPPGPGRARRYGLAGGLILALAAAQAAAEPLRIAYFHADLEREGPGLLLRDILEGADDVLAAVEVIALAAPDVILLSGIDYDAGGHALAAFAARIEDHGHALPHRHAYPGNRGRASELDLNGDGALGGPEDAQGYAEFAGQGAMALLSALPIDLAASRDFTGFLWRDLPGGLWGEGEPPLGAHPEQRLSATGHWDIALNLPEGGHARLWAWHATPPVFDGPEDFNGRRNHDEAAFWLAYLDGALPVAPRPGPFVLLGAANLDPADGDGRADALEALLADPRLIDPRPASPGGPLAATRDKGANLRHRGDPALDTADWPDDPPYPGNLRVHYILPSAEWEVVASGVWWPEDVAGENLARRASRNRLVWVDLVAPDQRRP